MSGKNVEAASGFEPLHRGFADLSLTTWVRRPGVKRNFLSYHGDYGAAN
jgi:hypothetical protein